MEQTSSYFVMGLIIFAITIVSGSIPFISKMKQPDKLDFPIAESIANGVFLGAGLVHMLSDASSSFTKLGASYPWAFSICGITFLLFLLSEYIGFFSDAKNKNLPLIVAITSTVMLSVHSFLVGTALGDSSSLGLDVILFLSIIAHKWAASFSLSVYINKTYLKIASRITLFMVFSVMVPLGIYFGDLLQHHYIGNNFLQPIFLSISAGTFIYLGTVYGLKRTINETQSSTMYHYLSMIAGFAIMAIVAIWL